MVVLAAACAGLIARRGQASRSTSPSGHIESWLNAKLDTLDSSLARLAASASTPADARQAFRAARIAFKGMEVVIAAYAPAMTEALNSAETQTLDEDTAAGFKVARGFQRIEPMLFSADGDVRETDSVAVRDEVRRMRLFVRRQRESVRWISPGDDEIVSISRLELARVSTLGIAGFDAAMSGDAIAESAAAVRGVAQVLHNLRAAHAEADSALFRCARYLSDHAAFDTFDRFTFVRDFANPAFDAMAAIRRTPAMAGVRKVWPDTVPSVYDARRFDVTAFAPVSAPAMTGDLVDKGRILFSDVALSSTGERSCASCHLPSRAFTDGLSRATPLPSSHATRAMRRTPTLLNAALQPTLFDDGRRTTLEDQIGDVLSNEAEMRARPDVARSSEIRSAIAAYVRSLVRLDAPFDRALRRETQLSDDARRGFNLFMGRARCGTCHFAPLFGGAPPPEFVAAPPEVIGVPRALNSRVVDPDLGRGAIDRRPGLAHAFKTPTVRNAARSAPYMHNGVFATLDAVLDFYDAAKTPVDADGSRITNLTLTPQPLHLSPQERRDLIAFIESLTHL